MTLSRESDIWIGRARDVTITGTLWTAWAIFWLAVLGGARGPMR